ncbi:ABC transporter ATP-binding protein [Salinicoccus roseus]|uniref:ABC transporter ATP-binding protein n=1 Tax=Salinicoccus roseus TaxID=45670 RepID=UPI000F501A9B|nr:ABC transporter ATP-binding protein [Salinicoccus roseus]RPE54236.1 putative ABC transport system ATP-binding protein [Salinicoccus roseus]GGA67107.1 peptide ABC transporter ATP-binding protein [Salinicoccus roseus]
MPILSVDGLEKTFSSANREEKVLKGINLEITKGEITVLTGASGSGKSTLLTIAAGLQKSTAGTIIFQNEALTDMNTRQVRAIRAKKFGFVFQHAHLVPFLTVKEQLELMMDTAELKWSKDRRKEEIRSILDLVDMWGHRDSYPGTLSGGEKQRVAIARAVVHKPEMLFADEPTASLDSKRSMEVMKLLRTLSRERNITVLMVTHEEETLEYADTIVQMKDGVIGKG